MGNPEPLDHAARVAKKHMRALDASAMRTLFHEARTANAYLPQFVPADLLMRAVELVQLGPTSANCLPMRVVFAVSEGAKARLTPALSPGNAVRVAGAPVTAICAVDVRFYDHLVRLFPHRPEFGDRFIGESNADSTMAFGWDNAIFQTAYLIVAARALGLDAGPIGGFDRSLIDAEFFPDGDRKSQYLVNLGYADDRATFDRLPRFRPEEIAIIL